MTALALDLVRRDGGTQPRDHISMEIAQEYAEALADKACFPAVTVFFDGTNYWLADGFHRFVAHELLGLCEIEAEIRQGTLRDAVLFSVGANAAHGYRRTNADKRRAVLTLLNDAEWAKWNDREISRQCCVSPPLVASLRHSASHLKTFTDSGRLVERSGTVYPMQTANIGSRLPSEPPIPPPQGKPAGAVSAFDWQAQQRRETALRAIHDLAHADHPQVVINAYRDHRGFGLPPAELAQALAWLTEFSALFPSADAERAAAVSRMLERIDRVAS